MDRHAKTYGAYCISPMPGQPQVAVTHAFFVDPAFRGKGYGKCLKSSQMTQMKEQAFDYAICTVRADNAAQRAVLTSIGWRCIDTFHSRAQDTTIELWGSDVANYREQSCE